jgi:hypothetical protein
MKFDLTKFPLAEDDTQLKDEKGNLANYRMAFMKAAATDFDSVGQPVRGEEKFKRFDMWRKIKHAGSIIELDAGEVVYLTMLARDAYPVIVAGQCRDFLAKPEVEVGDGRQGSGGS